jgi:bacterioferritin-associated ferredoxin
MIVCSCNVLSDAEVRACLGPGGGCPRTPAQVQRCLGCSPQCGGCAKTIRSIIAKAANGAEPAEAPCGSSCCGDPLGWALPLGDSQESLAAAA